MIDRISRFVNPKKLLPPVLFLVGAVAFGIYSQDRELSYKELIVAFALSIFAVIIFGGQRGIRWGFVLWVLTLALGYRTFSLTKDLAIHPSEILLWLLVACICVQRELIFSARLSFPLWLWMLMPFWMLGWWPLINGGAPWDRMLNEFRNFVLIIPLMIVAPVVLQQRQYWRYLLLAFFCTGSFIALLGGLEYWFPGFVSLFPEFVGKAAKPTLTEEGFVRAQFAFWGSASATFICVLALPTGIVLATWWRGWWHKALLGAGAVLQLLGIYIGGYRSMWLLVVIQATVASVLRLKRQGAILAVLCIATAVGVYQFLPRTTERAISGIEALRGQPTDTSAAGRKIRALGAVETTLETPFGSGWSRAGWVHSDFLQVSVNLGVIAALIFFGGFVYTAMRLGRQMLPKLRYGDSGDFDLSLFLSFIAVGGILAMEGVSVLPQSILPVWFVWVLADVCLRQASESTESARDLITLPYSYRFRPAQLSANLKSRA
jgi:hypothetical protein